MVPSTGLTTALYAVSTPFCSAAANCWALALSSSCTDLAKPRNNCDRITPELPRAPISRPLERASAALPKCGFWRFFNSSTPEVMVRFILVPVSPSGTGNTFSALTRFTLAVRLPAPASTI
ncbi:hypothetical protein D3C81_1772080 [compost metagenome]